MLTLDALVALVALPVRLPLNIPAVRVLLLGLYLNVYAVLPELSTLISLLPLVLSTKVNQ